MFHIFSNQKAIFSCHCYHVQLASLRKTAFLKHWYRILIFSNYYCNRKKMTHKNLYWSRKKTCSHKCKLCETTAVVVGRCKMARLFTFHCRLVPPLPGDTPSWYSDWGPWYHRFYSEYSFEHWSVVFYHCHPPTRHIHKHLQNILYIV